MDLKSKVTECIKLSANEMLTNN